VAGQCVTTLKVTGSILHGAIGIVHRHNTYSPGFDQGILLGSEISVK